MMSKTSSTKLNRTSKMMWFTTRQNIGLLILSVIATLIVYPGYLSVDISTLSYWDKLYFDNVLESYCMLLIFASCVLVAIYNLINFMYLYSKKSSDVFHAVPLKRNQLLISRAVSSLICTAIPVVIGYSVLLGTILLNSKINASLELFFVMLMYNVLLVLTTWAVSLFFMICSGSVFDFVVSCSIVNISLLVIPEIINSFLENYMFGHTSSISTQITKWLSPFYNLAISMGDYVSNGYYDTVTQQYIREYKFDLSNVISIIYSVVIIGIVIFATIMLYKRRKAESAGSAHSFKFIYILSSVLLSYELAFVLGIIFDVNYGVVFWIFAILMALLTSVAYGAVTHRSFKTIKQSLILGGVGVLCLALTAICTNADITKAETRTPKAANVESVEVYVNSMYSSSITLDGEDVELAIALHESIIDEFKSNPERYNGIEGYHIYAENSIAGTKTLSSSIYSPDIMPSEGTHYIDIEYNLKNGNTMSRAYTVSGEKFEKLLLDILKTVDLSELKDALKKDSPKNVRFEFYDNSDYYYTAYYLSYKDINKFIDTYLNDLEDAKDLGVYYTDVNIRWSKNEQKEFYIQINDSFANTIELLESYEDGYADLNEGVVYY